MSELLISSNEDFGSDWCLGKSLHVLQGIPKKNRTFTTTWLSTRPNVDTGNHWESNVNGSTISTCIFLINPLVTLLFRSTFLNLTRLLCIVKTTLTFEILTPTQPNPIKPIWKQTRQKTVSLGSLVNLSNHFHQKEQG